MHHKWQLYYVWFLRYGVKQTELLSFWAIFCPFTPLKTRAIKILKKRKKTPGYIIILHMCTINENYIMYGFWVMKCDRQNFLSFLTVFCPFSPLTTQKIKTLKKWKKKGWKDYHFTHVYYKWQLYYVWFLSYKVWQTEFFVILDCFLPF